ncbi:protein-disulfide reductase DsbD domain-containing protein [Alienimonas californiensis]|uniref:Uncharacterized protein n=1 Tax=Alienimonas californiensis TaxID=2527989 RepID=A0A517PC25_9PLAN|nr:protein-disulfide reductase DsbD domain-containing protein [Alienimonas californiensis]QDT16933.1 hypothetical protein CA12_30430 [Alienimonas californiensis]
MLNRLPFALLAALCVGALAAPAHARRQAADPGAAQAEPAKVRARAFLKTDKLPAGARTEVAVVLDVQPGWHVNTNPAPSKYAVPTTVTVETSRGTRVGEFAYPTLPPATAGGPRRPVTELSGRVVLRAPVQVPVEAAGGNERLTVTVKYQACNANSCLRPKTLTFGGMLPVAAPGAPVHLANAEWFADDADGPDATRTAER